MEGLAMKEKPILFSKPMVLALLNTKPGTWPAAPIDPEMPWKWQTRRIVKPAKSQDWLTADILGEVVQMVDRGDGWWAMSVDDRPPGPQGTCPGHIGSVSAPYRVGDILWVREQLRKGRGWEYAADGSVVRVPAEHQSAAVVWAHHKKHDHCVSIHMPRWACRITLEVMEVRCQRLQGITEEDAKAEGATPWPHDPQQRMTSGELGIEQPYRGGFACLWDDINEDRATWLSNPYLWAYSLKRVK